MKLVDTNVLLYAVNDEAVHHARVRSWWEAVLSSGEPIGLAWVVILGFLRLSTKRGVFSRPLSLRTATDRVDEWLALPNVQLVEASSDHWRHLKELMHATGLGGNHTSDAHLAALALARGATVVSFDTDFARYRHVKWENILISP